MKAGIVADNYKLDKFKKELTAKGFTDFKIFPFTKYTSTIKVNVKEEDLLELKKVCEFVEMYFKQSN